MEDWEEEEEHEDPCCPCCHADYLFRREERAWEEHYKKHHNMSADMFYNRAPVSR